MLRYARPVKKFIISFGLFVTVSRVCFKCKQTKQASFSNGPPKITSSYIFFLLSSSTSIYIYYLASLRNTCRRSLLRAQLHPSESDSDKDHKPSE